MSLDSPHTYHCVSEIRRRPYLSLLVLSSGLTLAVGGRHVSLKPRVATYFGMQRDTYSIVSLHSLYFSATRRNLPRLDCKEACSCSPRGSGVATSLSITSITYFRSAPLTCMIECSPTAEMVSTQLLDHGLQLPLE